MSRIRAGIGGWTFAPWRGVFYPKGLKHAAELEYASRQVTAIEINGTFYGSQKPASFRKWRDETPEDFVFSVKGPRFATHRRELAESASSLDRFFASGVAELGPKLGPLLWQFPPTTKFEEGNFAAFLELLPRRFENLGLRHVLEVRHASFTDPSFAALLRRHNAAAAFVDAEGAPATPIDTADFVYLRLKRAAADIPTGYSAEALADWLKRCRGWAKDRDCFVFFINGAKEHAPAAAMAFLERLGR